MNAVVHERLKAICSYWGWLLATGILLILLGTFALGPIVITTLSAVIAFGFLLIIAGIVQSIQAFSSHTAKNFSLSLLMGILGIAAGLLILVNPKLSTESLTLILGFYFITAGLFKTVTALTVAYEHWGWVLLNGIVTLLLGGMIVLQWPGSSLWVIGVLLAVDFIVSGWSYIILALTMRNRFCKTA